MILPFSYQEITLLLRLERAISRIALRLGYDGDPLADPLPQPQTDRDLEAAHKLLWQLPARLRNVDRDLALKMCRGAVWGRTREQSPDALPPTPSPNVDAKLSRERRRASA